MTDENVTHVVRSVDFLSYLFVHMQELCSAKSIMAGFGGLFTNEAIEMA